jgi:hypothetical protein
MSDSLAIPAPRTIEEADALAKRLAPANTLPEALRQKPADLLAVLLTGAELGMAPMQAVRAIVIIKGKPTLSAEAQVALVRKSPSCKFFKFKESTPLVCTVEACRSDAGAEPVSLSFSIEDARAAGLASNDNYRKFPAAMLRARAASAMCKMEFSDVLLGFYDPDELAHEERDVTPAPVAAQTLPPVTKPPVVDAELVRSTPPKTTMTMPDDISAKLIESGIAAAKSLKDLETWIKPCKELKDPFRSELRTKYVARETELRKAKPVESGAPA